MAGYSTSVARGGLSGEVMARAVRTKRTIIHPNWKVETTMLKKIVLTASLATALGASAVLAQSAAIAERIKPIPLNIDGALAAILIDLGLPSMVGKLLFIVGRVAGLSAEVLEEYTRALDSTLEARQQELDQQLIARTKALDDAFSDRLCLEVFDERVGDLRHLSPQF